MPHAQPFDVQSQHAAAGLVDAADLLVVGRLAVGTIVSVDVEHDGDRARVRRQAFGFIEQGRDPQARQGLVPHLADPVARPTGNRLHPLNTRCRLLPLRRCASQYHLVEHPLPEHSRQGLPLCLRLDLWHGRHAAVGERDDFPLRCAGFEDPGLQQALDVCGGRPCGEGEEREEKQGGARGAEKSHRGTSWWGPSARGEAHVSRGRCVIVATVCWRLQAVPRQKKKEIPPRRSAGGLGPTVRVAGVPSPVVCEGLVPPDESRQATRESPTGSARVIACCRSVTWGEERVEERERRGWDQGWPPSLSCSSCRCW